MCLQVSPKCIRVRSKTRTPTDSSGDRNETQYFHRDTWLGPVVRKRSEYGGTGEASANAHRRLSVRQLSVQHSEGREPSRLRTET